MVDLLIEFVKSLFIIFPAYAANGFPPLARGSLPIDFGRKWIDKRRIFGDGKTVEGFSIGIVAGTFIGLLETIVRPQINPYAMMFGFELPYMSFEIGLLISIGALAGDLAGSFIKRRLNFERGKEALFLDQWNFIIGSTLFSFLFTDITIWMFLIMLVITFFIHRIANIVGHKLAVKTVPW
jgi:CDP-2,3-bis-(O-geranylgeranyl)-sn-glycerol synthase